MKRKTYQTSDRFSPCQISIILDKFDLNYRTLNFDSCACFRTLSMSKYVVEKVKEEDEERWRDRDERKNTFRESDESYSIFC